MLKLTNEGNNKTRKNRFHILHSTFSLPVKMQDMSHESTYMIAVIPSPEISNRRYEEQVCSYKNHDITSLDFKK